MRRDDDAPRPARDGSSADREAATDRSIDSLVAAYVDGVGELTPDERRQIEAHLGDPIAKVAEVETRSMIARLRALPPEGREPDWATLERSIRDAVGTEVPRPWWRRWTWMAPLSTALTAALVLLIVWGRPPRAVPERHVPTPVRAPAEPAPDEPVTLWLDGDAVDVDPVALDALAPPDADADPEDGDGLLPSAGLAWVDDLDDEAIARAERWLEAKKKG